MTTHRVNVLVYSGPGSTIESVRHCLYTLRRLLSPNYAVLSVTADAIIKEPWTASCALFVMPGGADLGYCRTLNGEGNRKIIQYVNRGGAYLGLCAGGYYGSSRCEFEVGVKGMEVVGDRELGFFPGICRGLAFPGFVYASEAGAKAAELKVHKEVFGSTGANLPEFVRSYFNGGGVFVDAERFKERGVEILASYTEPLNVDSGKGAAALVYRKIGDGHVVLSGPHPEFAALNLNKQGNGPDYAKVVEALERGDQDRAQFFRACLRKLGLRVNEAEQTVPSLSRLHLTSVRPTELPDLLADLEDIIVRENGREIIIGANDTFELERSGSNFSMGKLKEAISSVLPSSATGGSADDESSVSEHGLIDYDKAVKYIRVHDDALPTAKETPYFNHAAYYSHWAQYVKETNAVEGRFGKHILYGEVVTSTNTMLEKNPSLLQRLHDGVTAVATTQVAGRGRGSNVWVAPPGQLIFSTIIHHPLNLMPKAPVIFIQYLAALAIVRGIQTYGPGYSSLPVKLKWPNDVYAEDPTRPGEKQYVKIGGILVNSSYAGADYNLVVGIGVNMANEAPTTSLNALAAASRHTLEPFRPEKLLARILTTFESIYYTFCHHGWSASLESEYYRNWLHTDQIVTLEMENGARARIKGITRDWGLLLAEELAFEDRPTGKIWELQSDSNSFDFLKGLLKRKV
ncbi:biotin-[acetyl-CoA-carboxylase] ligase [Verruconis gallopava]|uniref:Biotin-[acetyl-CoA-carboxylase] ligase n=1 Tax=Verruconis gallopava TaxID=253628 RepID=A0A0D1Z5X2_9PEZI|nr:biotin-[acetyl-CoA-carboxylase] ligase [Verruconis gallopava]KIW08362.1 biotin-[acetyl-CoA-carboxylase] ligase [Verruconis gallopava]